MLTLALACITLALLCSTLAQYIKLRYLTRRSYYRRKVSRASTIIDYRELLVQHTRVTMWTMKHFLLAIPFVL